jgi:Na+/H+ antiporter NhaD/arsenite permease-like protein
MKIDRPGAAVIGAVLMVAFRIIVPLDALQFIDFSTIVLLFSMMLIVAYLRLAGLFDWITHLVVTRLKPHHLLPTVILTSGVLSAFFVNDIICLVMVPFVLTATRRMAVRPLPYLLAVATAAMDRTRLVKPGLVILLVIAGFFGGAPPALMAAFGAAIMLITRTRDPHLVYEEVDWGLPVFFVGLFIIVGGAEKAGITDHLLGLANHWNLHHPASFTVVVAVLSNVVSNVPAVMLLRTIVEHFPNPESGWLALAMASTLAGNLTITGSIANIIVVERAAAEGVRIGFGDYFKIGLPVTVLTTAVGALWLWLIIAS